MNSADYSAFPSEKEVLLGFVSWVVESVSLENGFTWIKLKDTKLGIWGYKQFELICGWAAERYGVDLLDKEGIAWKPKYPKVAAKIDDLELRITKLEKRRK